MSVVEGRSYPRPVYRPDYFVIDRSGKRYVNVELTAEQFAILDRQARQLNLARGSVAHDLLVERLNEISANEVEKGVRYG